MNAILPALALLLCLSRPAHAYMEPGTGSLLIQLALGGGAGLAVALKMYWKKVAARLGRPSSLASSDEPGRTGVV